MSLKDFRNKYPQYNDLNDKQLTTGLWRKYGDEGESYPEFLQKSKATHVMDIGDETKKRSLMTGQERPDPTFEESRPATQDYINNLTKVDPEGAKLTVDWENERARRNVAEKNKIAWDKWTEANRHVAEATPMEGHEAFRLKQSTQPATYRDQTLEEEFRAEAEDQPHVDPGEGITYSIKGIATAAKIGVQTTQAGIDVVDKALEEQLQKLSGKAGIKKENLDWTLKQLKEIGPSAAGLPEPVKGEIQPMPEGRNLVETAVFTLARSAPSMLGQAMNKGLGASMIFFSETGSKEAELKARGIEDEEVRARAAMFYGVMATPAEFAGNMVQLKLTKGIGTKMLKGLKGKQLARAQKALSLFDKAKNQPFINLIGSMGFGGMTELGEETIQGVASLAADAYAFNPTGTVDEWKAYMHHELTSKEYWKQAWGEGKVALVAGMLLPGATGAVTMPLGAALEVHAQRRGMAPPKIEKAKKLTVPEEKKVIEKETRELGEYYKEEILGEKPDVKPVDGGLTKKGKPFKSEATAKVALQKRGIHGSVVPIEGGFAIKPTAKPIKPADKTKVIEGQLETEVYSNWGNLAKKVHKAEMPEDVGEMDVATGKQLDAPMLRKQMLSEGKDPNKDWLEFSKRRGYTDEQITDFTVMRDMYARAMNLADQIDKREEVEQKLIELENIDPTKKEDLKVNVMTAEEMKSLEETPQEEAEPALIPGKQPVSDYWFTKIGPEMFNRTPESKENPKDILDRSERMNEAAKKLEDPVLRGAAKRDATLEAQRAVGLQRAAVLEQKMWDGKWRFQFLLDYIQKKGWDISMGIGTPYEIKDWAKYAPGQQPDGYLDEIERRRGVTRTYPADEKTGRQRISVLFNPVALGQNETARMAESTVVHELIHAVIRAKVGSHTSAAAQIMYDKLERLWNNIPETSMAQLRTLAAEYEQRSNWANITKEQREDRKRVTQLLDSIDAVQSGMGARNLFEELIAYGLSDEHLALRLSRIEVPGVKPNTTSNLWREILRVVSEYAERLLGKKHGTVMDEMLNILMDNSTGNIKQAGVIEQAEEMPTGFPKRAPIKKKKQQSEADKEYLRKYRAAKAKAGATQEAKKTAMAKVKAKVKKAEPREFAQKPRTGYPGKGLDFATDKYLMQEWSNMASEMTAARESGVTDVKFYEWRETRIQIIKNKLDANAKKTDTVKEAKSPGATKTTVKNAIRDLEARKQDLQANLDHYKKHRWPMRDQLRLKSEIKKVTDDVKSLAETGRKAPRKLVVSKKTMAAEEAERTKLEHKVQDLADSTLTMVDSESGMPTAYFQKENVKKHHKLLNEALIAKAITKTEYDQMIDLLKALTVPEFTEQEEVNVQRASLLRIAVMHPDTDEVFIGQPGDMHHTIIDRHDIPMLNFDDKKHSGWSLIGKKGNSLKFLNRKETTAFVETEDVSYPAESVALSAEMGKKADQLSNELIEHVLNSVTWNRHGFKFEAYYDPKDGYAPSGYSFHSENKDSPIYGMSLTVDNLEQGTIRKRIEQVEKDRAQAKTFIAQEEKEPFRLKDDKMEEDRKRTVPGIVKEPVLTRTKEWLKNAWTWRFEFPEIAKGRRGALAELTNTIRKLKSQRIAQAEKAVKGIVNIVENLDQKQYQTLEAFSFMMDSWEQVQMNKSLRAKGQKALKLPNNWEEKKVEAEAKRLWQMVKADDKVMAAWKARMDFWNNMRHDYMVAMKNVGYNVEDRLKRQFYFRHQVLDYLKAANKQYGTSDTGKLAVPTKASHLRKRKGSTQDINRNYIQAEFEVMAQMLYDTKVAEAVHHLMDKYGTKDSKVIKQGGYTEFKPIQGSVLYLADTIPAHIAQNIINGTLSEFNIKKFHLKKKMALGGTYDGYYIPDDVNEVLTRVFNISDKGPIVRGLAKGMLAWKMYQLLNPLRAVKYNARNLSGDAEAIFVGNWRVVSQMPLVFSEVWKHRFQGKPSKYIEEWVERGGPQSTLQSQEMTEIIIAPEFRKFRTGKEAFDPLKKASAPFRAWFKGARWASDKRESWMRLAAYMWYRKDLAKNKGKPSNYGASMMEEVDGLIDNRDKAFMLSNDLLGAYDRISVGGEFMRGYVMPFWSFQELNMRRMVNVFRNAAKDNRLTGTIGRKIIGTGTKVSAMTAMRVGKIALAYVFGSAMMAAWNHWQHGDDEDKLPEEMQRRSHVILRGSDETKGVPDIWYFPRLGILGDLLEWVGLDTAPNDLVRIAWGKVTWAELAKEYENPAKVVAKGFVEKAVQSVGPHYKIWAELIMGEKLYPSVFDRAPIIDRWDYAAEQMSMKQLKHAVGWRQVKEPWDLTGIIAKPFIYKADVNRMAYLHILEKKDEFLKEHNLRGTGFIRTEQGRALYYMGAAWRYGDKAAFQKHLKAYTKLTFKLPNLDNQWDKMDPLHGFPKEPFDYEEMFLASLNKTEQKVLNAAMKYHLEIKAGKQFMEKGN